MQPALFIKEILYSLLLVFLLVIIIRGGQLVAIERTGGITIEPLEEAVLMEDVGAGHGPECRRHSRLCAGCILLLIRRSANALRQMAQSLSDESSSLVSN